MQSLDRLKSPEPGQLPNAMKNLKVGETYQALVQPTVTKWTGLTSSATQQIKDADGNVVSALIVDVLDAADAPLTKVYTGAPGAGEVKITFDSDGQPLLTFNAAVTAFGIYGIIFPFESVSNQTKELLQAMANTKGQTRLGLSDEIGKYGATPAAALVCEQIKEKSAAYQMLPDDDTIFVDTSGASVTITLPSVLQAYKGKVYSVVKLVAANSLVLDGFGSDPVESGTGVTATARWERISVVTDGTVWVRATPGQGGVAPTGVLLAANNLSDLASAATAQTNLGGTTVGKAVFTAANVQAALAALGFVNYADDAAAALGGVPVGGGYQTAGVPKTRMV